MLESSVGHNQQSYIQVQPRVGESLELTLGLIESKKYEPLVFDTRSSEELEQIYVKIERESRFCLAIINQAIRDLKSKKPKVVKSARFWFENEDSGSYTLNDCCEAMERRLRIMGRDITISAGSLKKKCLEDYEEIISYRQPADSVSPYDPDIILRSYLTSESPVATSHQGNGGYM